MLVLSLRSETLHHPEYWNYREPHSSMGRWRMAVRLGGLAELQDWLLQLHSLVQSSCQLSRNSSQSWKSANDAVNNNPCPQPNAVRPQTSTSPSITGVKNTPETHMGWSSEHPLMITAFCFTL